MPFLHNQNRKRNTYRVYCESLCASNGYRFICSPKGGTFSGYFVNGLKSGYGIKTQRNNLIYSGTWANNKRDGNGIIKRRKPDCPSDNEVIVRSQWKNGMKDGKGEKVYASGKFCGTWKQDKRSGLGIMWYRSGNVYVGEWENDLYHGFGNYLYDNGNRYEGRWKEGKKHGKGKFMHVITGQLQIGEWQNGVCVQSYIVDDCRSVAKSPTPYPITNVEFQVAEFLDASYFDMVALLPKQDEISNQALFNF